MTTILYKEFLVQRTLILLYAAITLFFAAQLIPVDEPLTVISILAMFFTFGTAAHEDKNNSHVLLNSLPVSRKEIVTAKYAFHLAIGLCLVGFAFICKVLISDLPAGTAFRQTAVAAAIVIWFVAAFFPMYYWLGPRFVQIGMIVLFILMLTAIPMVLNLGAKHRFWGIMDLVQSFPEQLLFALLTAATVILLIVSRHISVRLYERKEF